MEYSTVVAPASVAKVAYTTTDHLGSPRVITDALGQVSSRRDFMPFGEDLNVGVGNRTGDTGLKYSMPGDNVRQKFTGYQKDNETQLDFAEARMYENRFGRFTAVDPLLASGKSANPQTFNRYAYVGNNPMARIDPSGTEWIVVTKVIDGVTKKTPTWIDPTQYRGEELWTKMVYFSDENRRWWALNPTNGEASKSPTYQGAYWQYGLYSDFEGAFDGLVYEGLGVKDMAYLVANMKAGNFDQALATFMKIGGLNGLGGGLGKYFGPIIASQLSRFVGSEIVQNILSKVASSFSSFVADETGALTVSKGSSIATNAVSKTLNYSVHALERLAGRESHITESMILKAIEKGSRYFDPKNGSICYVLKKGLASGEDLLVGTNPFDKVVTTVVSGNKLVRPRFKAL